MQYTTTGFGRRRGRMASSTRPGNDYDEDKRMEDMFLNRPKVTGEETVHMDAESNSIKRNRPEDDDADDEIIQASWLEMQKEVIGNKGTTSKTTSTTMAEKSKNKPKRTKSNVNNVKVQESGVTVANSNLSVKEQGTKGAQAPMSTGNASTVAKQGSTGNTSLNTPKTKLTQEYDSTNLAPFEIQLTCTDQSYRSLGVTARILMKLGSITQRSLEWDVTNF